MKVQAKATDVKFNLTDADGNVVMRYQYDNFEFELDLTTGVNASAQIVEHVVAVCERVKANLNAKKATTSSSTTTSESEYASSLNEAAEKLTH